MTIYHNHAGYTPLAAKTVLMGGILETAFEVCAYPDGPVVYRGELRRAASDFGQ